MRPGCDAPVLRIDQPLSKPTRTAEAGYLGKAIELLLTCSDIR